jgi:hypothetical protein
MAERREPVPSEEAWLGLRLGLGGDAEGGRELADLADDDNDDGDGDFFDDEDYDYLADEDDEDDDCVALGLQTCCRLSAEPLVRCAVNVADSADRTVCRASEGQCAAVAAELPRLLAVVSGLLAQVHAVVPGMGRTDAVRLCCPLGRLSAALSQFRALGCPWACGHPDGAPDRRAELEPLGGLLKECAAAIAAAVGFSRQPRWGW